MTADDALIGDVHRYWMRRAITLSHRCPPAMRAYSVGAIIVDATGNELASGYSRENDSHTHAEEAALSRIRPDDRGLLPGATVYTTLEPCSERASQRRPCAQLTVAAGLRRVVLAWREPGLFVADCQGVELLQQCGIEVIELTDLAEEVRMVNAHLAV